MHAVILERNKLVGRKVARLFMATGATTVLVEEPGAMGEALDGADVLCADVFDGDYVAEMVRSRPGLRAVLVTAEPLRRSMRYLIETRTGDPRRGVIDHVLGRRDFESPPRAWEVVMLARRLAGAGAPPIGAYLDWGYASIEVQLATPADRDRAVERVQDLVGTLAVPKRVAEMFGELAHEQIMNAMYGAPVDAQGRSKYAADRKAELVLEPHERPTLRCATDGSRLVLQVTDPFGRLGRHHVMDGLARGLAGGAEPDRENGGAGLGMMVCHNSASAMFFDVIPARHTEVTALFELDLNLREFRTQARSLHWSIS